MSDEVNCVVCGRPAGDEPMRLRRGKVFCQECLDGKHKRLVTITGDLIRRRAIVQLWAVFPLIALLALSDPPFALVLLAGYLGLRSYPYLLSGRRTARSLDFEGSLLARELGPAYELWPTYPPDWQWRRREVHRRDGGTCQRCGRNARRLDVHHIVPVDADESTHGLVNLILLCRECHSEQPGHGRLARSGAMMRRGTREG